MPDMGMSPDRLPLRGGSLVHIDFTVHGNSSRFRREGWSGQEPLFVWAVGFRSSLALTIPSFGRPLVLEFEVEPNRRLPTVTGQIVRVTVNGADLGSAVIRSRAMVRCELDPAIIGDGDSLAIAFECPGFYRPGWLRPGADDRPLSLAFTFVRVYTKDMMEAGPWCAPSAQGVPVIDVSPPPAAAPGTAAGPGVTQVYTFGPAGTAAPFLERGWSRGEGDFNWTIERLSEIEVPVTPLSGCNVLRIDVTPLVSGEGRPTQDLNVVLDSVLIGHFTLNQPTSLVIPLPRELTEGREILPLRFITPDSSRPCDLGLSGDKRLLGFAFRRLAVSPLPPQLSAIGTLHAEQAAGWHPKAASSRFLTEDSASLRASIFTAFGEDATALLRHFESLGDNCEFGIVQRKLSLEVFNLLRFGNAQIANLMVALTDDLAALNDAAAVTAELNHAHRREFVVSVPAYKLRWHTFMYENETDQDSVLRANAVKLGYLRRKFYEGLRAGRKIYVIKRQQPLLLSQAAAVLLELNRHGRATLLCVEPVPVGRRSGEVDLLMPGLMRGYIAAFAPEDNVEAAEPTDWLRLTANARLLQLEADAPCNAD